jgi:hypothetical protein
MPPGGWKWIPFGAGSRGDPADRVRVLLQLIRGPFQQQPAPQRAGGLAGGGRHQPVEVEPAQVRPGGDVRAGRGRLLDAADNDVEQLTQLVPARSWCHPDSIAPAGRPGLIVLAVRQPAPGASGPAPSGPALSGPAPSGFGSADASLSPGVRRRVARMRSDRSAYLASRPCPLGW